jgi:hypothetical protein
MPSRRSHQNSHHGCINCKRRKIKCDERRQGCVACAKKQLTCNFVDGHVRAESRKHHNVFQLGVSDRLLPSASNSLPLLELDLLHQWHTSTAYSLFQDQEVRRVMKDIIPKKGLNHPFLMNGLLAIAALHRIQLSGTKDSLVFVEASIRYKQRALLSYTPLLNNITKDNCEALFAFSCLLSILCSASQALEDTRTVKAIADVVDIFRLTRGVAVIVAQTQPWLQSSEVSVLLRSGHFNSTGAETSCGQPLSDVEFELRNLIITCRNTCKDSIAKSVYESSIQQILNSYNAYAAASDITLGLAWPVVIDPRFFDLLIQEDQLSLAIFAYYGAIMSLSDDTWWVGGWGQLLAKLATNSLHPSLLCKIKLPLKFMQEGYK